MPEAGASQLPVGTGFGSVFWHQAGAELSAGSRVALEMVPGSTRARKIKKEKRSEEKRDFIGLETVSEVGQGVWWILLGSVGFPGVWDVSSYQDWLYLSVFERDQLENSVVGRCWCSCGLGRCWCHSGSGWKPQGWVGQGWVPPSLPRMPLKHGINP